MNKSIETNSIPVPPPPAPIIDEKLVAPVITYVLIALTVAIYLLQVATQALMGYDIPAALGMKSNPDIIAGQIWRLVTPMFLHGSILHIGFNMYALVIIGSGLERRFGHWRFLLLYVLGSIAGNVFSFLLSPNPSLGASTAIFGLLGAEMVFFYQNREMFGKGARRALQNVVTVAAVLSDIRKEVNFCKTIDLKVKGVIENMSGFVCPNCNKTSFIFAPSTGGCTKLCADLNI